MDSQSPAPAYAKTLQNSVNRYRHLSISHPATSSCGRHIVIAADVTVGNYDAPTIHSIVNSAPIAHVAFISPDTQTPVVLPMMARIGHYDGDNDTEESVACYLHGSATARLFRRPQQPSSGQEGQEGGGGGGIPVCIAATKILGLVLTLTPYSHTNRPGPQLGRRPRRDALALQLLTDGAIPGRWANSRTPPDETEINATRVLKVRIDSASAKVRHQGVDEEAKDLKDETSRATTWTGVVPYLEVLGVPQPAPTNRVGSVPSYIQEHIGKHNRGEFARSNLEYSIWGSFSSLFFGTLAWVVGR
ncbi:hypothetical protein PG994_003425 [Apiospora phragmitis]|uniref:Uncharacterized protein n=1 Tax=Apiospora phragmitis TaxID=2905665 RepID=A0ABR1VY43_9PEZI